MVCVPERKRDRRSSDPGGTGLAFHRARKEKEVWEAEERQALLQQEKANMAAELQAMEDQQTAQASAEQHNDGE